jgi:hypothetical protein
MIKRKRAPGGGRKPGGEFRNLTAVMSLRMPQDLRDQLERARKVSKRSLSQELIARAEASFGRDRDQSRDRALRAFCFLFSELQRVVCVDPELDWRSDPWLFQAFKLAVAKLLDRFQPAGETKLPQWWRFVRESPSVEGILFNKEERERITESPEAMAEHAVQRVLWSFDSPQRLWDAYKGLSGMEEKFPSDVRPFANRLTQVWGEIYYGMDQARRDLAPKSRRKNK